MTDPDVAEESSVEVVLDLEDGYRFRVGFGPGGGVPRHGRAPQVTGDSSRVGRCLELFEDYCVVTDSVRRGLSAVVEVEPEAGHADGAGQVEGRHHPLPRAASVLAVCVLTPTTSPSAGERCSTRSPTRALI